MALIWTRSLDTHACGRSSGYRAQNQEQTRTSRGKAPLRVNVKKLERRYHTCRHSLPVLDTKEGEHDVASRADEL